MEKIQIIYHHEPEGWWADSPDVKGWLAAGESFTEVRKLSEEGIPFTLERDDVELEHFVPADEREHLAA